MVYPKDLELFRSNRYRSKRLKNYFEMYSKDNAHVLVDFHIKDVLEAQGLSVDEAPRSIYKVEKLYEALSLYAPGKIQKYQPDDNVNSGVALAYKSFAWKEGMCKLHVMPMTPATIVAITSNPSGSPGLTSYGVTKAESQTRALERGLQTLQQVKKPEPCLAFKRTQFNDKTRLIWGYPYSMTVIEGIVAKPLLEVFKKGCTPMAFAMVSGALGTKLRVASYHKTYAYSLDMSSFDATIGSQLIHIAFKILRTWYDLDEVEPVSGKTVGQIFDLIEKYFVYTPIVMPDGNIYYGKDHGVPSGSYFTQIVDSIVNVIIGGTISSNFSLNVSRREVFVLGDDLLMWSNRRVDLNVIADYANKKFGVRLHGDEKSRIYRYSETIHYLGRDWTNGMPDLPVDEIVKRMVYPESFRQYPKDREAAKRQAKLCLLNYAYVYRSAWRIAYEAVDQSQSNIHRGCANVDVNIILREGELIKPRPEFMSGLQRFHIRIGLFDGEHDMPLAGIMYPFGC